MIPQLLQLSEGDLRSIATALRSGHLGPPFPHRALQRTDPNGSNGCGKMHTDLVA